MSPEEVLQLRCSILKVNSNHGFNGNRILTRLNPIAPRILRSSALATPQLLDSFTAAGQEKAITEFQPLRVLLASPWSRCRAAPAAP
jgi:hypothetical protein